MLRDSRRKIDEENDTFILRGSTLALNHKHPSEITSGKYSRRLELKLHKKYNSVKVFGATNMQSMVGFSPQGFFVILKAPKFESAPFSEEFISVPDKFTADEKQISLLF